MSNSARFNYVLAILALIVVLGINFTAGQSSSSGSGTPQTVETEFVYLPVISTANNSIFGSSMQFFTKEGGLDQLQSAFHRWSRIDLDWAAIEPSQGVINWGLAAVFDQGIKNITNAGMKPIIILGNSPAWALKPGFPCGVIRQEFFAEFARFAGEAVKRYSSGPYNAYYYEIYNEPDAPNFLGCWGDPSDQSSYGGSYYGLMLKSVYPAMKATNSHIQVLFGGLLLDCDPLNPPAGKTCTSSKFLEGALKSGAGGSFDGVAFHAYDYYNFALGQYSNPNWHSTRNSTGPSAVAKAAFLRGVLQQYGVANKPLYNTEFALFIGNPNQVPATPEIEETKAYYMVHSMAIALANHFETAIWFSIFGDRNNSLLNPDLSPLPIYNAYSFTNKAIGNATFSRRVPDPNFVIYEFGIGNRKIWIVWTASNTPGDPSQSLTLPEMPIAISRIGSDGNPVSDPPGLSVTLDVAPAIIQFGD